MNKRTLHILITVFMAIVTISCAKDVKKEKSPEVDASTHGSEKANDVTLKEGNMAFAFDLYSKLNKSEGNLFFSPYSISSALAMTYGGAKKSTEEQMTKALHFPYDHKAVHDGFSQINKTLGLINDKGDVSLSVANSIFPAKNYKFLESYITLLKDKYNVSVTPQDFAKAAEDSRININTWVEEQTNKKISDLIGKGVLDELTKMVLVNAVYFKGNWKTQFSEDQTKETDFYNGAKSTKVQMMSTKAKFKYAEDNLAQIIELPYKGEDLSMMIILPKEKDSILSVENSLNHEIMDVWAKAMLLKEVTLFLPKFKIEWGTEAIDGPLKELGIVDAFTPKADFSGMSGEKDLFIKTVLHKAFIEVNEEGSEAAAATAVVMARASMNGPKPIFFRADHPFIFMIKDKTTETILFMGRVTEPK